MKENPTLRCIAIFKLIKGFLMIGVSFGIFRLIHANLELVAFDFLNTFRVDPDNSFIRSFLERFVHLSPATITQYGIAAILYSMLLLTEGVGLWLERRWAHFLVIFASGLFIPLELEKLMHHPTAAKLLLLVLNLAIVSYLAYHVNSKKEFLATEPILVNNG